MQAIASLLKRLRIARRSLAGGSVGFPLVVVLSLAVGVGFSSAVFSAYNAIYLQPLPVERPHELAWLQTEDFEGNPVEWFSYPDYLDYRRRSQVFSGLLAYSTMRLNWGKSLTDDRVTGVLSSRDYFSVAGISPAAGRFFSPADGTAGPEEAVLSYRCWKARFQADPGAVGKSILLNDIPATIIGIAPAGFNGLDAGTSADVWIPVEMLDRVLPGSSPDWASDSSYLWLTLVGRLQADVTLAQAQAAMNAFELSLQQEEGPPRSEKKFRLLPAGMGSPKHLKEFAAFLSNLGWAVAVILLVVCVNLCSLAAARSLARRREFALRIALGAGRLQLLGMLMGEAILLSAAGATLALLTAQAVLRLLPSLGGGGLQPLDLGPINGRTVAFAVLPCLFSALAFAVVPLLRLWRGTDVSTALRLAPLQSARQRRLPLRSLLIMGQIALSLVLLTAGLLLVRSLRALGGEELGFEPANVLLVSLGLGSSIDSVDKGRLTYGRLMEQVEGLPGVESASLTSIIFGWESAVRGIQVPGYRAGTRNSMNLDYTIVGPGYFETMEIPVRQGRAFRRSDDQGATPVAVINSAMQRRFWPREDPLGKVFLCADHRRKRIAFEVVGVVEDSKYIGLRDDYRPLMYFNYLQVYDPQMNLLVRTNGRPIRLEPSIRREVASFGADLRVLETLPLADHIDDFFIRPIRRQSVLLTALAVLAVLLAAGGLYGAVSYFTAQRRFEIGVRLALGAKPSTITGLVLSQAVRLAVGGIAIGLLCSIFLERWLTARLYKVTYHDPLSLGISAAILLAAAVAAAALPARSASRLDPAKILGSDTHSV